MRIIFILIFSIYSLNAQKSNENSRPHPAASFCKALGVTVDNIELSDNETKTLLYLAEQYIRSHANSIRDSKTPHSFWLTFETLLSGLTSKKSFDLIKRYREIKLGNSDEEPLPLSNQLQTMKFAIGKLQRGSLDQKKYAWMLAYAINQICFRLQPEVFNDYNTLFAMVDQSVRGMSWRPVQQKKFVPSIITARIDKGAPLKSSQTLSNRPDFLTKNKAALFSKAAVKQLYTVTDKGASKILLEEVECNIFEGPSHRSTSFDFDIGLSLSANVSFGEVVSFLSTRYPYLEPYKEVVFSAPKAINDDSSSGGLGLALLLTSLYEGVAIDPSVISCADITVNGNVSPAYDMTEKIKKAASQKDSILLISIKDYQSLMDAFIIWGHSALWGSQVIAVRNISEAINFARQDKSKDYLIAINEFREIQKALRKSPQSIKINKKRILKQLTSVLNKIPTHASARSLYNILKGKVPSELSIKTSLDLFIKTCKPLLEEMFEGEETSAITKNACASRLSTIKKGLNKSIYPLVDSMNKYIYVTKSKAPEEGDKTAFLREWKELTKDRKFVDRMRR